MKLFNTLTRQTEEIKPLIEGEISLYTCGLTVYSQPHIGNWVAYIYWDILQRTLQLEGYKVKRVQNITDVGHLTSDEDAGEDKMLKSALSEGNTAWQVAEKYIDIANHEAYELLGLIKPEFLPRATDYIDQQIDFVKQLEQKDFTYTIADGVYFDTSKLDDYGKLAQLDIKGLRFGARVEDTGKKNPTDFAVWKFSNPDEKRDMQWESPWGTGFPGWHLECSCMAREILGDQIDIHTGGIDHIPVHHTNEIAQTEALTNKQFATAWVHANHIKVNGTKMSKSLGNIYTLKDITDKGFDLQAFKLMILSKHYSTEGNFTWENLEAAQNRLNNWKTVAAMRWQTTENANEQPLIENTSGEIFELAKNNLDTPAILAKISTLFRHIETNMLHTDNQSAFIAFLSYIDDLLGLDIAVDDITDNQKELITKRQQAKERKDFATADSIRHQLKQQGVELEDRPETTIWYVA
jgi:cysteinyl-tRNA synthetase